MICEALLLIYFKNFLYHILFERRGWVGGGLVGLLILKIKEALASSCRRLNNPNLYYFESRDSFFKKFVRISSMAV